MAPHSTQVEEVFDDSDYQRVNPFSAEAALSAAHARRVDKQIKIANELSRLVSDEYLEDIMQHARAMEVGFTPMTDLVRDVWLTLQFIVGRNSSRRQPDRHAARDPMVHATLPD